MSIVELWKGRGAEWANNKQRLNPQSVLLFQSSRQSQNFSRHVWESGGGGSSFWGNHVNSTYCVKHLYRKIRMPLLHNNISNV